MWGEPGHEVCVHIPVVREPAVGQWEGSRRVREGGEERGEGRKEGVEECQHRGLIASTPTHLL